MIKQHNHWIWREDELSIKEYYSLSKEDKEEYLLLVEGLKPEELSSGDIIILNLFSKKKNIDNFFSIDKY